MGLALGCLFVPLTTISMDPIPRENMGNATSLFNLVRNLGGSIGIAAVTTLQIRYTQNNIHVLGAHVDPYNPASRAAFMATRQAFMTRGSDPVTAANQARAALFGMVQAQAAIIAYNHVFLLLGILFFILLPFVFLLRRAKHQQGGVAAH